MTLVHRIYTAPPATHFFPWFRTGTGLCQAALVEQSCASHGDRARSWRSAL